jgi:hypothetical protein
VTRISTRVSTRIGGRYRGRLLPRIGNGIQTRPDLTRPDLTTLTSYGCYVVLPTVDESLTAVDVRARRKIQPSVVEELAPLAFGSQR